MVPMSNKISRSYARLLHKTHGTAISWALVVAMVNIVALLLCGLLPRLKLIDLFVKVDLCDDVRAVAQTTQPKSGLSRFPPRLECVTSRPRDETIEHDLHAVDYRLLQPDPGLLESVLVRLGDLRLGLPRLHGLRVYLPHSKEMNLNRDGGVTPFLRS
jgi:hypothetical protein